MLTRNMLLPSVRQKELGRLKVLGRHFRQIELDVHGLRKGDASGLDRICKSLDQADVKAYSVHLRGFNISGGRKDEARRALDFAMRLHSALKPSVLVMHPGYWKESILIENVSFMARRLPADVTLAIETMESPQSVLHSIDSVARFVAAVEMMPDNLGICLDTTHPALPDSDDPQAYTSLLLDFLSMSGKRLKHLHLSDRSRFNGGQIGRHLQIGEGMIDWGRLLNSLHEAGYPGKVCLEVRGPDHEVLESAERLLEL